jgi:hypothetical protein
MSKGDTTENDVIKIMFRNAANTPSYLTASNLYVALHKTDPGDSGTQLTGEADYSGYARVTVAKDSTGWDISGNQAQNHATIAFNQCNGATGCTAYYVSIGTADTGAPGQILYLGTLTNPLAISLGIQPQFVATALTITED